MEGRQAYTEALRTEMWKFLARKLERNPQIQPKGNVVWEQFRRETNSDRSASSLTSHFRKRMWPYLLDADLDVDTSMFLFKALHITLDADNKRSLEQKYRIIVTLNADNQVESFERTDRTADQEPNNNQDEPTSSRNQGLVIKSSPASTVSPVPKKRGSNSDDNNLDDETTGAPNNGVKRKRSLFIKSSPAGSDCAVDGGSSNGKESSPDVHFTPQVQHVIDTARIRDRGLDFASGASSTNQCRSPTTPTTNRPSSSRRLAGNTETNAIEVDLATKAWILSNCVCEPNVSTKRQTLYVEYQRCFRAHHADTLSASQFYEALRKLYPEVEYKFSEEVDAMFAVGVRLKDKPDATPFVSGYALSPARLSLSCAKKSRVACQQPASLLILKSSPVFEQKLNEVESQPPVEEDTLVESPGSEEPNSEEKTDSEPIQDAQSLTCDSLRGKATRLGQVAADLDSSVDQVAFGIPGSSQAGSEPPGEHQSQRDLLNSTSDSFAMERDEVLARLRDNGNLRPITANSGDVAQLPVSNGMAAAGDIAEPESSGLAGRIETLPPVRRRIIEDMLDCLESDFPVSPSLTRQIAGREDDIMFGSESKGDYIFKVREFVKKMKLCARNTLTQASQSSSSSIELSGGNTTLVCDLKEVENINGQSHDLAIRKEMLDEALSCMEKDWTAFTARVTQMILRTEKRLAIKTDSEESYKARMQTVISTLNEAFAVFEEDFSS